MRSHCHLNYAAQQQLVAAIESGAEPRWVEPLRGCVPQLVDLLCELGTTRGSGGGEAMRHPVQQIVTDHCAARGHGDSLADSAALQRHVDLLLRELERVHHLTGGAVPPQMFG